MVMSVWMVAIWSTSLNWTVAFDNGLIKITDIRDLDNSTDDIDDKPRLTERLADKRRE